MSPRSFDKFDIDALMNPKPKRRLGLHIFLFLLTAGTTYLIGLGNGPVGALWYSGGLMAILVCHEAGHYLAVRRHGIRASLPYFIPLPLPPFGTMGAVIKMDSRIPHRRALLDVGAAGPFAGLAVILPVILFGLRMSEIVHPGTLEETGIALGDSLLFRFLSLVAFGPLEKGQDILLHPLAFAGWVGLLITAINLLPVGQLDGGHILYALFHRHGKPVARIVYGFFIVICLFFYFGWFLMLVLVAIFRKHPPTLADEIPLDPGRKWAGALALSLFVLSLTPVPFGFGEGLVPMILKAVRGTGP